MDNDDQQASSLHPASGVGVLSAARRGLSSELSYVVHDPALTSGRIFQQIDGHRSIRDCLAQAGLSLEELANVGAHRFFGTLWRGIRAVCGPASSGRQPANRFRKRGRNPQSVYAATGQEKVTLPNGKLDGLVASVAFSSDGQRIVFAGGNESDGTVQVWDATTGQRLVLRGHRLLTKTAFCSDCRHVVSAAMTDNLSQIRVWNDGQPTEDIEDPSDR
jgi:hypothetical protein